ncbi:MAG TPA: MFS transporter [Streptosporangiaceae bacterium]|nr:MFS transporter [Streptosporangiaceae bacterium]
MSITIRGEEHPHTDQASVRCRVGRHRTGRNHSDGLHSLLAVREIRALWMAQVLSSMGDQVAQVAIAVLVYARTGSPFVTALAYALTYLPLAAGRPLLSRLVDSFPQRQVLITLDLVRAGLLELMALPQMPLPWIGSLLFVVMLLAPPFSEARADLLRQFLPERRLGRVSPFGTLTSQASQAAGFLAGGVLVATLGPDRSLVLDGLSFCLSACLITYWVKQSSAPKNPRSAEPSPARADEAVIFHRPALRTLVLLSWLAGFAVVPEGLAVPYAHALGGGATTAGLLMATMPAGMVTGALVIRRLARPDEQERMIGWLAMLSCAPLISSVVRPPLWLVLPLWGLAGVGATYQLTVARVLVGALPSAQRARAFTTAQTGLLTAQALGILIAGAAAARIGPQMVVAVAGLIGVTTATALASDWARHHAAPTDGSH